MKTYRCIVKRTFYNEPYTYDFAAESFDTARQKLKSYMWKNHRDNTYEVLSIIKTASLNG